MGDAPLSPSGCVNATFPLKHNYYFIYLRRSGPVVVNCPLPPQYQVGQEYFMYRNTSTGMYGTVKCTY